MIVVTPTVEVRDLLFVWRARAMPRFAHSPMGEKRDPLRSTSQLVHHVAALVGLRLHQASSRIALSVFDAPKVASL
jgi:hypothetical protein